MAEALVAVGLAANVVQFIEVGCRFASSAWRLYSQDDRSSTHFPEAKAIAEDMRCVLKDLETADHGKVTLPDTENGFRQLVENCRALAQEILEAIQESNVPDHGRKRDALKGAFRGMRREEEIRALQDRLGAFRQQLTIHLLALIR